MTTTSLPLTDAQIAALAERRCYILSSEQDMRNVGYDIYVSIPEHSPSLLAGEVLVALAQRVQAAERRAHAGAAGCRKNVYDPASSPCTCQGEVEREWVRADANERLLGEATARIAALEAALRAAKANVMTVAITGSMGKAETTRERIDAALKGGA